MQQGLFSTYLKSHATRGPIAWVISVVLFAFYLILYYTETFTQVAIHLHLGDKWNLYGLLYTLSVLIGGVFFLKKHGHTPYQRTRTLSLMGVQLILGFSIPALMEFFHTKSFWFSYFWPLKIEYFYPDYILHHPLPVILYIFLGSLVGVPLITFFWGKRWYCSWVCGCGGLAETAGDPFRHLSNRGSRAWRFEQVSIHTVMLLSFATTAIVIINWGLGYSEGGQVLAQYPSFSAFAFKVQRAYGFVVVAMLSGVAGVGLYPLMGSRVWCRFFCPQAALMGLIQKFGRFRITVKDDMCIAWAPLLPFRSTTEWPIESGRPCSPSEAGRAPRSGFVSTPRTRKLLSKHGW
jgi:hypothetical protein